MAEGSLIRKVAYDRVQVIAEQILSEAGNKESARRMAETLIQGTPDTAQVVANNLLKARLDHLERRGARPQEYDDALAWFLWLEGIWKTADRLPPDNLTIMSSTVSADYGALKLYWEDFTTPKLFDAIFNVKAGHEINLMAPTGYGKSHQEGVTGKVWLESKPNRFVIHNVNQLQYHDPDHNARSYAVRYLSQVLRTMAEILLENPDAEILFLFDEPAKTLRAKAGGSDDVATYNDFRDFLRKLHATVLYGWQGRHQVFKALRDEGREDPTIIHIQKKDKFTMEVSRIIGETWSVKRFQGVPGREGFDYDDEGFTAIIPDLDFRAVMDSLIAMDPQGPKETARVVLDLLGRAESYREKYRKTHGFKDQSAIEKAANEAEFLKFKEVVLEDAKRYFGPKGFSPPAIQDLGVGANVAKRIARVLNQQVRDDLEEIRKRPESYQDGGAWSAELLTAKAGYFASYAEVLVGKL